MERPVKVHVSLTMDLQLQPDQSKYGLARTVQQQVDQLLKPHNTGKIDMIKVFEGHGDALTLPMREPAVELEGMQGVGGWELVRKDPSANIPRTLNLRSGTRSASDPISIGEPPGAGDYYRPEQDNPSLLRKQRMRREKKAVGLRPPTKVARSIVPNLSAVTKMPPERKFRHEFEDPQFNKRLRKDGILGAFAPKKRERVEKVRTRRSDRDEVRRWVVHDKPDEDKKMDIIIDEFAAAFDFNAPVIPTKAERRAARQSLASSIVFPRADDMMDTSGSTEVAQGSTRTTQAAGCNDPLFQVFS